MSGERNRSISESLVLDDTSGGVVITGITDDNIAAKSGLQAGDEIVAATIHLDHLKKNEVLDILKVLEPYDNNMKVLTKKELNPSAGLGSFGSLDLRSPSEMLGLKKDLSLDTKAKAPSVSLNGLDGDIRAGQGLGGEISGPTLNGDLPSLNLSNPSADTGASFALPSFGLTGTDVKGDLDGNLKAPNVKVSTPKLNAPSVDIEKPEIKTGDAKFNPPKFSMPHFGGPQIKTPNADANISGDLDLKTPDLRVSGPDFNPQLDLKTSDVKLETPNVDLKAPKKKLPHHTWKGLKMKGPKADVNSPDVNLSTPKIDGALTTPDLDVNLPKAGIEGPTVDVQAPDIEAEAPSGKWSWLPWNWNKPKISGPKADVDIDASRPDLNLSSPKIDGEINGPDLSLPKGPGIDVNGPDLDIDPPSSKFTWPHKKWKKHHGPKVDLNADLDTPDLSVPKIDGPDLCLTKGDLDVNVPDANIEAPSGKIKFPTLKKPKIKASGLKVDTPDVDLDAKAPDLSLSTPTLDADIDAPSGKMKFPTLKKPKWAISGPKASVPDVDIDADVSTPDLSLQAPKIDADLNAPDANLDINGPDVEGPSGFFKGWKLPKIGHLKGPKADLDADLNAPDLDLKAPNLDLKSPDLNLSGPKIDGGIGTPDLDYSLPSGNLQAPKMGVDVNAPDANLDINGPEVEGPSGFFKGWKLPKIGTLKGPKADLDADINAPNLDLKAPNLDLKSPDLNLSGPKIDGGIGTPDLDYSLPSGNLQAPKMGVDVNAPDANLDINGPDVEGPSGFFKGLKLPKIGKMKGPKADLDADLNAPDLDLKGPNLDLKSPDLNLSGPKIDGGIGTPDLDYSLPSGNLQAPKMGVDVNAPDANLDINGPDVEGPSGFFKGFKLPKIGTLKGPKADLDANVNAPNVDLKGPNLDLKSPDLNLSGPKIDGGIGTPDLDYSLPSGNLQAPKMGVDVNAPDANLDINGPDVEGPSGFFKGLKLPKIGKLKGPKADLDADVNLSGPKIDGGIGTPDLDYSLPSGNLQAPRANIGLPNADLSLPEADFKAPDAQLKTPSVDLDSKRGDFKLPHFKLPKFGASDPKVEVPSVQSGIEAPGVNIAASSVDFSGPKVGGNVGAPNLDLKAPTIDANVDADADFKGSPKSKLKSLFKWGRKSSSDDEGLNIRSEVDAPKADLGVPGFKFHKLPTASIDASGGSDDAFGLPKLDTDAKDYVMSKGVRLPILNTTSKSGEKVDIFERLRMAKEKLPSANTSPTDSRGEIDLKLPSTSLAASADGADSSLVRGGTFKVEKPDSVLDLAAPTISTSDDNERMSLSLTNMLGLNVKDSD